MFWMVRRVWRAAMAVPTTVGLVVLIYGWAYFASSDPAPLQHESPRTGFVERQYEHDYQVTFFEPAARVESYFRGEPVILSSRQILTDNTQKQPRLTTGLFVVEKS